MKWWWSVDPGQRHVGVAQWMDKGLIEVQEFTPDEYIALLWGRRPPLLVIEGFSLLSPRYNKQKAAQAVDTIKLIGGTRVLMDSWGTMVEQQPALRKVAEASPYWKQVMNEYQGSGRTNVHTRSAVAHGIYYAWFGEGRDKLNGNR